MSNGKRIVAMLLLCGPLLLAAGATAARAADDETVVNNWRKNLSEEKFAQRLGEAVIGAAHPTGGNVTYKRHTLSDDNKRNDRKVMTINMTFTGAISGKTYAAEVEIRFDAARDSWEVLDIDCTDGAPFAANRKNMDQLKKRLNAE